MWGYRGRGVNIGHLFVTFVPPTQHIEEPSIWIIRAGRDVLPSASCFYPNLHRNSISSYIGTPFSRKDEICNGEMTMRKTVYWILWIYRVTLLRARSPACYNRLGIICLFFQRFPRRWISVRWGRPGIGSRLLSWPGPRRRCAF